MATPTTKKVENTAHQAIDSTKSMVQNVADKAKDQASTVADKAKDVASSVTQGASHLASSVGQSASHLAGSVSEGAGNLASGAAHKADDAAAAAGSSIQSFADTLRKSTPNEGMVGAASNRIADTLESGGKYLEEQGLTGMADDLAAMVKRYPIGALVVGVGIGYILARATSRS